MSPLEAFAWGFLGSVAVEIITIFNALRATPNGLPARYRSVVFWIVRALVAFLAGGLALAYGIPTPILAMNVGAATPLLIQALARGAQGSASGVDPSEAERRDVK